MKLKILIIFLCCNFLLASPSFAATTNSKQPRQDDRQWSVMLYHGNTAAEELAQLIKFKYTSVGEDLYSGELAYALADSNPITKFFNYLFINRFQIAGNIAMRQNYKSPDNWDTWVPEFDLYVMIRRTHFPWDRYLRTSLGFGEGISYATSRIYVENNGTAGRESPRFLNFLAFEITFALPKYPYLELVGRIHHRSACYGLFYPHGYDSGSNNVGIGIRYYFH